MIFSRNFSSANEDIKIKGVAALDRSMVIPGVWCHDPASLTADVLKTELYLPRRADLRRRFVRNWAARNAQRILSGLGAATLLLPMTMPSHAQQSAVDVTTIDGVVSAVIEANGDVILTLASGKEVRIPASGVTVTDEGTVLVSSATADAVVEIAMAESGAGGTPDLGLGGILGGLAVLGGAAAGSGGGGGDGDGGSDPFESAFVVDGYISGATVFADTNNNGILDAGELSTVTDANGEFNKALFSLDAPLVSRGGIDISTGEVFEGTLKAPAGSGVITPLTTLVQSLVESSAGTETPLTAAEAAASVSASLGLPGGSDILNDDPVADAEGGASELLQINAVIASIINVVSAGSDEASADANVDAVLTQLLTDLEADADGGLTALAKSDFIAASLTNSGATLQVDATSAGDALTAVAIEISAIDPNAPDALDAIETVQTVVQGDLVDAVQASAGDTSGTSALDTFDVATTVEATASLRPVLDPSVAGQPIVVNAADADPSITLFGTGQIGSTVAVTIGDATGTSVVDGSGNWTVTFTGETFPSDFDGTASVTASKQVDGQTITSSQALSRPTVLIDTEAPAAPSAIALSGETLVDGIINDAEDGNVTITGQAEAGATVTLTPAVGEALVTQADGTGAFSFDILFAVEVGTNSVTISQTDAAGNSSPGAAFDFGYDPIAPDPSLLDQTLEVNAAAAQGGITISGSAEAGATVAVEVAITGTNQTVAFGSPVVADGNGDWSVTAAAPADAVYDVTVIQTDTAGNSTSTIFQTALSVDTTPPAAPVLTSGTGYGAGDAVEGVITLVGATSPLADVELTFGQTTLTTTADAGGVFSFDATLPEGATQVSITATDAFGNSSAPLDATVTVDTQPPVITDAGDLGLVGGDVSAVEFTPNVSGATEVTITIGAGEGAVSVTGAPGATLVADLTGLGTGTYSVTVSATDGVNTVEEIFEGGLEIDITPPAQVAQVVVLGAGDEGVVNAAEVGSATIEGVADAGASVTLADDQGTPLATTTADGLGAFSFALSGKLATGSQTFTVFQSDAVGNTSTPVNVVVEADIDVPGAPVIDAVTGDNFITGNEVGGQIEVSGTGETDASIEVFLDGVSLGTPQVITDGTWSVLIDAPTVNGSLTITAEQTDAAGNISATAEQVVTVNLDSPSVAITSPAGGALFGTATAGAVVVSGTFANANSVSLEIRDGATLVDTVAATLDAGTWSASIDLSALGEGDYTLAAVASDGNTDATSDGVAVSVDLTPPTVVIDTVSVDDTVGPADLLQGDYTLTGTVSESATVFVSFNAGQPVEAVVNGTNWSITRPAATGTDNITVTATDAAGNDSDPANTTITVDVTAPDAPTFANPGATIDDAAIADFAITGTAEPGSTVTVTSSFFDPIVVVAAGGAWTTGSINATGTPDGDYQISATATDAEGNTSASANTTLTIDAVAEPPVTINLIDNDELGTFFQPGDLILQDAVEFGLLDGTSSADGNVTNVPAGTAVRVIINPGPGAANGAQIELSGVTDVNGVYSITIPDQTFFDIDGMVEAGTITIEVGPDGAELATFTLDLLVNSAVNDGTGTTFNVGTTAVTPGDDASAIVANAVSAEVTTGAEQTGGLTVVGVTVATDDGLGGTDDFNVLLAYNGSSATPVELFAFDDFSDLPSVSSQLYAFPDELVVAQINATGDLTVEPPLVQQDPNALFNIYRIPAADVAAVIPVDGSQSNLNLNGVPSFSFSLADIGGTGPLNDNEVYLPFDITGSDGQPVWIVFKEDLLTGETLETYLVQIDLLTETVSALEIDVSTLVSPQDPQDPNSPLSLDDFAIFGDEFTPGAIETDAGGNFVRAIFEPATPPADLSLTGAIVYDYGEATLYSALIGNDDAEDFIIVEGGNTIIDGGAESANDDGLPDNDVILVGSTTGTETPLNIVDNGNGTVTLSILTSALIDFTSDAVDPTAAPLPFALNLGGDVFINDFAYGGIATGASAPVPIDGGNGGAVFDVTLNVQGLADDGGTTEIVTINVTNTSQDADPGTGGQFFGIGFTTDFDQGTGDPIFDTLQLVSNVDGSGEQVIILADSAGRSGQDKIIGFDTSSGPDGDRIEIEATTFGTQFYAGTEVAKVSDGLSILENGIGILVFDTASQPLSEDPAVLTAVSDLSLGLNQDDQLIVLTGDDSGVFVWRIGFDANGAAIESDSIARFDGITASDLGDFNGTNISMTISEFA